MWVKIFQSSILSLLIVAGIGGCTKNKTKHGKQKVITPTDTDAAAKAKKEKEKDKKNKTYNLSKTIISKYPTSLVISAIKNKSAWITEYSLRLEYDVDLEKLNGDKLVISTPLSKAISPIQRDRVESLLRGHQLRNQARRRMLARPLVHSVQKIIEDPLLVGQKSKNIKPIYSAIVKNWTYADDVEVSIVRDRLTMIDFDRKSANDYVIYSNQPDQLYAKVYLLKPVRFFQKDDSYVVELQLIDQLIVNRVSESADRSVLEIARNRFYSNLTKRYKAKMPNMKRLTHSKGKYIYSETTYERYWSNLNDSWMKYFSSEPTPTKPRLTAHELCGDIRGSEPTEESSSQAEICDQQVRGHIFLKRGLYICHRMIQFGDAKLSNDSPKNKPTNFGISCLIAIRDKAYSFAQITSCRLPRHGKILLPALQKSLKCLTDAGAHIQSTHVIESAGPFYVSISNNAPLETNYDQSFTSDEASRTTDLILSKGDTLAANLEIIRVQMKKNKVYHMVLMKDVHLGGQKLGNVALWSLSGTVDEAKEVKSKLQVMIDLQSYNDLPIQKIVVAYIRGKSYSLSNLTQSELSEKDDVDVRLGRINVQFGILNDSSSLSFFIGLSYGLDRDFNLTEIERSLSRTSYDK